jgi:hypothetical protein
MTPRKKWTVLVYMGADDDNDAAMVRSAFTDVEEMRTVRSSDHLNIAVQLDLHLFKPVRFRVNHDGTLDTKTAGLGVLRESSTGRPNTLYKFLTWARTNAPAQRYMLILWGHGLGVGHSVEEASPRNLADVVFDADDGLSIRELGGVLRRFRDDNAGRPIDVLGFDACYMSCAEIGSEYRGLANFIAGSQVVIPYEGWPYEPVLKLLRRRPQSQPEQIVKHLVQSFIRSYPNSKNVTQTALRPADAATLQPALRTLVTSLDAAIDDKRDAAAIHRAFKAAKYVDARQFLDLKDLCRCLRKTVRHKDVRAAAKTTAGMLKKGSFVVEHRRKGRETERLHGVSVYVKWLRAKAKPGGTDFDVKLHSGDYKKLQLVDQTGWQDFHDRFARRVARRREN